MRFCLGIMHCDSDKTRALKQGLFWQAMHFPDGQLYNKVKKILTDKVEDLCCSVKWVTTNSSTGTGSS